MANYLLVYYGGMRPETTTPAQRKKSMDEWMVWFGKLGKAVVEMGGPAKPGKVVGKGGARAGGADGISGYTIVKADNLDAAVVMAKGCPGIKEGGKVTVNELIPM